MYVGLSHIIVQVRPWMYRALRLLLTGHQGIQAFSLHVLYSMDVVLLAPQPEANPAWPAKICLPCGNGLQTVADVRSASAGLNDT